MSERYYYYDIVNRCFVSQYPGEEGYRHYEDGTFVATDKDGRPVDTADGNDDGRG